MEKETNSKIEGYLLLDKPTGISSFDLIKRFKRLTGYKSKVGHAGTLDAFASGLIILLLSRNSTRNFAIFNTFDKEYEAGVRLGWSTPTLDVEGEYKKQDIEVNLEKDDLLETIKDFIGKAEQEIPVYSAVKSAGGVMYKQARKGRESSGKSKEIEVKSIELVGLKKNLVNLRIICSSGTYIRQLTYDIFKKIGYESFLYYLRRTRIGEYHLKDAMELRDLESKGWEKRVISVKIA